MMATATLMRKDEQTYEVGVSVKDGIVTLSGANELAPEKESRLIMKFDSRSAANSIQLSDGKRS